jgi:ABC-type antimicrobial peptide transport system permease subunit
MVPRSLVADVLADILSALTLLLKREGFVVANATSPAGVLDIAQREHVDVALVVLNYSRDTTSGEEGVALVEQLLLEQPDLALYWVRTLDEARAIQTAGIRLVGTMFAVFAGVALVLAAAGLFGVLAFHVGQRTREIGVRRALGADDGRILRMILRASGLQVGIGILIGMLLLPVMGSSLGDILGDVSPFDPAIYTMVLSLMVVIAILATLTPTRRALKVDPAAALRYE